MGLVNGTAEDNTLNGTDDSDTIFGFQGRDVIFAGRGADVVYGNQDDDLIYGNQGADILFGGQGQDTIFGGQDADVVYGNLGNDVAYGNLGNDTLYGGQGDDVLYGGQGDDVLIGGLGNDTLYGNLGLDEARYSGRRSDFEITTTDQGTLVRDLRVENATDLLVGVELITFEDVQTQVVEVPGPTVEVPGPTQIVYVDRPVIVTPPDVIVRNPNATIDNTGFDPLNGNRNGPATTPGPFFPVGSGNPATSVASVRNETKEVELAVDYVPRQGSNVVNYTILQQRADGSFDAYLPQGNQRSVAEGGDSQSTSLTNAAYSRNFLINADTDIDDTNVKTLNDYDATLIISGAQTGTYDMQHLGDGNTPFLARGTDAGRLGFGDDDAGQGPRGAQTNVYAQSINNGFGYVYDLVYGANAPRNEFGAAEVTFTLNLYDRGTTNLAASITVHEHIGGTPPAPVAL